MSLRRGLCLFLIVSTRVFLHAHPHMWIETGIKPVVGPEGLEAVDIIWEFDDFNSSSLINSFDINDDGILDRAETDSARLESFTHLLEKEYYLVVDVAGLRGTPGKAENFKAEIIDGQLIYSFRVPLEIPIRWEDLDSVGLYLFDASYFIDFRGKAVEDFTVNADTGAVNFYQSKQELVTEGYGSVAVTGIHAGDVKTAERQRTSISALIKDRSYQLQERLASYTRKVVDEKNRAAFWASLGLAVVFGLLHVLGPGHGKVFTLAYFTSRQARLREGLMLSALINILDSFSAFLLVGLTYGILSLTIQSTGAVAGRISRIVAYGAIFILGISHVIAHFVGRQKREKNSKGILKPWMLALSVGLIPCPVSSALLAYGMAEDAFRFSLLLVAGVSLGGMIALSLYSFLIISGKAGLVRVMKNRGFDQSLEWFELLSMGLLALVGAVLLLGVI